MRQVYKRKEKGEDWAGRSRGPPCSPAKSQLGQWGPLSSLSPDFPLEISFQAQVARACYLPPHCALSSSGSSQWEVLPDVHAVVSPKAWQSEAVSQLCSLQQDLWKGEVKGHGHKIP